MTAADDKIGAVIAALRTVQEAALRGGVTHQWDVRVVNRWIARLPGARWGRWRQLKLRGPSYDRRSVLTGDLVLHLNSVLAYLEASHRPAAPVVELVPGHDLKRLPAPVRTADAAEEDMEAGNDAPKRKWFV